MTSSILSTPLVKTLEKKIERYHTTITFHKKPHDSGFRGRMITWIIGSAACLGVAVCIARLLTARHPNYPITTADSMLGIGTTIACGIYFFARWKFAPLSGNQLLLKEDYDHWQRIQDVYKMREHTKIKDELKILTGRKADHQKTFPHFTTGDQFDQYKRLLKGIACIYQIDENLKNKNNSGIGSWFREAKPAEVGTVKSCSDQAERSLNKYKPESKKFSLKDIRKIIDDEFGSKAYEEPT